MIKIIISPAKKMNVIDEYDCELTHPVFMEETRLLHNLLNLMSREELKKLWQCSDKLTDQNYDRLHSYELEKNLTPALIAYEGIQYQYMAPHIFADSEWNYVSEHLRILSGFYGILKPTDGVIPYRLEMQAKLRTEGAKDLYQFWGDRLYQELCGQGDEICADSESVDANGKEIAANCLCEYHSIRKDIQILNLASAEYSKTILPYIQAPVSCVTCIFGELVNGKVKMKGTQAKMARGEMVRWMAENQIEKMEEIRGFNRLNYTYSEEFSTESEYVFLRTDANC